MKISKSIFATIIFASAIFTVFAETTTNFSDIDDTELYKDAIQFLYDSKIVKGYDDGTFKPQKTINRAEMVKIIAEAKLKYNNIPSNFLVNYSNEKCFSDVPVNEWFTKYVCYGKEQGWIVGYENGKYFRPANTISFVEALKITFEGFDLSYVETSPIWYKGLVQTASVSNYIPFDIYDFNGDFRRNQMADLITRILKHKEGQEALDNYLGERSLIIVTYETIEQGLDLSKTTLAEDTPDIQPEITNPGTPFVYINYLGVSDSSIPITIFDPLNNGGKPINSYKVIDNTNYSQPELFKILYKEGNISNSFTLDGLTKDAEYDFTVKTVNEEGLESKVGDLVHLTVSANAGIYYFEKFAQMEKPDAPGISIVDQASSYITLKITPPAETGQGEVEYYAIEIEEDGNYIPYKILYLADLGNDGTVTLSGLIANKEYEMRIRAINTERVWSDEEIILKFTAAKNGFSSIDEQ